MDLLADSCTGFISISVQNNNSIRLPGRSGCQHYNVKVSSDPRFDNKLPDLDLEESNTSIMPKDFCYCCKVNAKLVAKLELKEALYDQALQDKETAYKQLRDYTSPGLHPALLGSWQATHDGRATITDTRVAPDNGDPPYVIETLAPYAFCLNHKWGRSQFTLLPSLQQMVEVNFTNGHTHMWAKK